MGGRNPTCQSCNALCAELTACHERIVSLESEATELKAQLAEATNLVDLQRADIERYKAAYEKVRPNTPERVPKDQLQLAFLRILESLSDHPSAQELAAAAANDNKDDDESSQPNKRRTKKNRDNHTRRRLDLTNLPVEDILIDPEEVVAANGEGYELIGEEVSDRVAFRPGGYIRLHTVRRRWVKKGEQTPPEQLPETEQPSPMVIAPLPEGLWPSFMADPSAVAQHIISKYGDCLPLHRQEKISGRNGFRVPRSTQCGWLREAYKVLYRIVAAMLAESIAQAFCIATDATGAPVRANGSCEKWHIFVFIADRDHVVFQYSEEHTSEAMKQMLGGFNGHLLADAAPIYDILHREGAIESACWFHLRRYFWRGLSSDQSRALEILSLIAKLFEIDRQCRPLALPERTEQRAARSQPVLDVIDEWVERNKEAVDPKSPLDQGIGYYQNQRDALHRFRDDGRLRLDNSISEQQLRNAVLGRHNWMFFANETGLKWYTVFRSLIASCFMHDINPHEYTEQVLRLAPHWPVSRVLELSPKYWQSTLKNLDERQRNILLPPWHRQWPALNANAPPKKRSA